MAIVNVRPMEIKDIDEVMEIENSCFVAPWKKEDILKEINDNVYAFPTVIELINNQKVVGFVDYWITFGSATICQIAIKNEYRRLGLATTLLKEVVDECYNKKASTLSLEVRVSNVVAINFYQKNGFVKLITKPKYYSNGEDAILMCKEVKLYE